MMRKVKSQKAKAKRQNGNRSNRTNGSYSGLAAAGRRLQKSRYQLKLYVAGATPRSAMATKNIAALCEKHLKGRYQLEVVDIYQRPVLAVDAGILAAPTLVKTLPLPIRRLIGDMSDEQRVLLGLSIKARRGAGAAMEAP